MSLHTKQQTDTIMRILDKHILRNVLLPVVFCVYTLVLLFLIADVFDNLSEILRNKTPIATTLTYYGLLIPFAFSQTISWAVYLGMVYMFTTFTRHNEIIAMKAAGHHISAIARPLIFLGFALSVITFALNDRVVPYSYHRAEEIKKKHIEEIGDKDLSQKLTNLSALTSDKQYFVSEMFPEKGEIYGVTIHFIDEVSHTISKRAVAQKGIWGGAAWTLYDVSLYEIGPDKKIIGDPKFYPEYSLGGVNLSPEEIQTIASTSMIRSIKDTRQIAERLRENGISDVAQQVDIHEKIASPWMNLIIILLVLPFLGKSTVRQVMIKGIILSLAAVFFYHVLNAVCLALGKQGTIPPILSAWAAHIIVGGTAVFFMDKANR